MEINEEGEAAHNNNNNERNTGCGRVAGGKVRARVRRKAPIGAERN